MTCAPTRVHRPEGTTAWTRPHAAPTRRYDGTARADPKVRRHGRYDGMDPKVRRHGPEGTTACEGTTAWPDPMLLRPEGTMARPLRPEGTMARPAGTMARRRPRPWYRPTMVPTRRYDGMEGTTAWTRRYDGTRDPKVRRDTGATATCAVAPTVPRHGFGHTPSARGVLDRQSPGQNRDPRST